MVKVQGQRADVYFLDHGDSDVVNVNVLRSLPPKYNQLPYQVILFSSLFISPFFVILTCVFIVTSPDQYSNIVSES